jgi:hypothetical protein
MEINWELYRWHTGKSVQCVFNPRPTWGGQPLKPGMEELRGRTMLLTVCWKCEDDEKYPGEYALEGADPDTIDLLRSVNVTWIASGDVLVKD